MVFFVRITANQSHLRLLCKSKRNNPKDQRTIYSIHFQELRQHTQIFILTIIIAYLKTSSLNSCLGACLKKSAYITLLSAYLPIPERTQSRQVKYHIFPQIL